MTINYIEKAKVGRPAITFNLEKLEELVRRGLSYEQIAQFLSINFKILASHRKKILRYKMQLIKVEQWVWLPYQILCMNRQ